MELKDIKRLIAGSKKSIIILTVMFILIFLIYTILNSVTIDKANKNENNQLIDSILSFAFFTSILCGTIIMLKIIPIKDVINTKSIVYYLFIGLFIGLIPFFFLCGLKANISSLSNDNINIYFGIMFLYYLILGIVCLKILYDLYKITSIINEYSSLYDQFKGYFNEFNNIKNNKEIKKIIKSLF